MAHFYRYPKVLHEHSERGNLNTWRELFIYLYSYFDKQVNLILRKVSYFMYGVFWNIVAVFEEIIHAAVAR